MIVAMADAAVYIAMVGGGGTDVWHRSSCLGNRVSSMCVADGRTDGKMQHASERHGKDSEKLEDTWRNGLGELH